MKTIFAFLFPALGMAYAQAQNQTQNDRQKLNLKGPVHSVELKSYRAASLQSAPGLNAEGTPDQYLLFNEAGNLLLRKESGEGGIVSMSDSSVYNPEGRLTEHYVIRRLADGGLNNTLFTQIRYDETGKRSRDIRTYIRHRPEGDDSSVSYSTYSYDESGRLLRIDHKNPKSTDAFNAYTYHPNGNPESNRYFNEGLSSEFITRFDEAGRPVEKNLTGYSQTRYVNNSHGDPEKIWLSIPDIRYTCRYRYDAYGNWIYQLQAPENEPKPKHPYTLQRSITYR